MVPIQFSGIMNLTYIQKKRSLQNKNRVVQNKKKEGVVILKWDMYLFSKDTFEQRDNYDYKGSFITKLLL